MANPGMSMLQGTMASEPRRQGEIPAGIDYLDRDITSLEELVEGVVNRLSSVTFYRDDKANKAATPSTACGTPIGSTLSAFHERLQRVQGQLYSLREALEL